MQVEWSLRPATRPMRQQTKPVGHAVRFGYLETAVAMLCRMQGGAEVWVNEEVVVVPPAAAYPDVHAQVYDPRQIWFLSVCRTWQAGDTIALAFNLPIITCRPHPQMQGYEGKVAISRGPLVYCLESVDNPEIDVLAVWVDAAACRSIGRARRQGRVWCCGG